MNEPFAVDPRAWGAEIGTLYNVGKGTKKYFSVQVGRYQGASRELTPVN